MAKFTRQAIMYSMLKLLQKKSIDKITVKDICELCEINRNTFYYYYSDIFQVLEELLKMETEESLIEDQKYESFYEDFLKRYHLILEYKKAVYNLYNSKNRELILKYFQDITEDFVEKYVSREVKGKNLLPEDIKFIIAFYSSSMIGNTLQWMQKGMQEKQEQLIYKLSVSYQATIKVLIAQFEKNN
ncbi:MAG: TetR-like C-terminal domain-containing protein [Lachnospiraceae bacterium]